MTAMTMLPRWKSPLRAPKEKTHSRRQRTHQQQKKLKKEWVIVLEAIKKLTDKVDTLGTQIQQNSTMLASIAKAVEFNTAEIKDCKVQLQTTVGEVAALRKDSAELME